MSEDGAGRNIDKSGESKDRIKKILTLDSETPTINSGNAENETKADSVKIASSNESDLEKVVSDDVNVEQQSELGTEAVGDSATEKPLDQKAGDGNAQESTLTAEVKNDLTLENNPDTVSDETVMIEPIVTEDKTPFTPDFGKTSNSPIEVIHAIGDLHGWAPGLISYLIHHKLATIEIDGYPLQTELGELDRDNLDVIFPDPIAILRKSNRNPPSAGLAGQPGFTDLGLNNKGHGSVMARWIAEDNVALIQVGDIYDRADHSELASEILRQLIIDAPGRVFVLVGNHEQFMLENDFDNWYFNEARSAWTDVDSSPKRGSKNHFRFLPKWDLKSVEDRARATFERYINATQTLFLTQGAVMQKLGWLSEFDHDLSDMLEKGWSGYSNAKEIIKNLSNSPQLKIPGALTALVIGDTLFHHAEPSAHRPEETKGLRKPIFHTMSKSFGPNNISFRNYTSGNGALKASPDAPLLWSRGSSVGAASGKPAAEDHISELVKAWPGLKRIVHGHTPTVTSGDFDSVTDGKSTSVSYLGDSKNRIMERGRANNVRIYNIDEGMSPVYYNGDYQPYDPSRMPVGLRLEDENNSMLESLSVTNQFINLNPSHNINNDVRELWRWGKGEWRTSVSDEWSNLGQKHHAKSVTHGSWRGFIIIPDQNSESSKTLYNRSIGGTQIGKLMIQKLLNDCFSQGSIQIQEPRQAVLDRIGPVGELLSKGKTKLAWNTYKSLLVLFKPNQRGGFSCVLCNSIGADRKVKIAAINNKKSIKPIELQVENSQIIMAKLSSMERLFVGLESESIEAAIEHWNEVKDSASIIKSPVIGYFSSATKFAKKLEVTESPNIIQLAVIKPDPVISDSKRVDLGSKKKLESQGSFQNGWSSSAEGSLKEQGSGSKKQEKLVRKSWGNQPKSLDQQKTMEDSATKAASRKKNPSHPLRAQPKTNTLDDQAIKANSNIKGANHDLNKPKSHTVNPSSHTSNQNQKNSQTSKKIASDSTKIYQAFKFGFNNRPEIRIERRDDDGKMTNASHIEFKVTELTSIANGSATIELVIEEPDKKPAKFLLSWRIFDEYPIAALYGGSGFTTEKILNKWRKKHLEKYIYSFVERLIEEGDK